MFVLEKNRFVKNWPVDVVLPVDGGKVEKHPITIDLKILGTEEGYKILQGDVGLFKETITGWSGISDTQGQSLPFNEHHRDELLNNPFFALAAVKAYQQASNGFAAIDEQP
ncbi:TPA: hypothetical protein RQL14_004330 [Vibrio vulnificus]|nr:hypothetical protein [Vibrio parahaemolyticus]HDY8215771.1 hypothetical protein [Vibrio vulnificus]